MYRQRYREFESRPFRQTGESMNNKLEQLKSELRSLAEPKRAEASAWFFKTGPGQYAEGDRFLGVTVPNQRKVAKKYKDLSLRDVEKLILSPWHEERLTGIFILVSDFIRGDEKTKKDIYDFYMSHTENINNWDLVDSSASYIVGSYLEGKPEKMAVLQKLASSSMLWERRIAMIATLKYIVDGRADEALVIAEKLIDDKHDLIQKAVGWMLREVGKRVDRQLLVSFLSEHYKTMPRTALRYAIEHFDEPTRQKYLKGLI